MTEPLDLQALMKEPLHPDLVPFVTESTVLGKFLRHPLVFGSTAIPGHLNRQYEWKRVQVAAAEAAGDWAHYLFLHERPYRLPKLGELAAAGDLTLDQLRDLLPEVWRDTELPHQFGALPRALFRRAGFLTDAPKEWDALPAEVTVWRGGRRSPTSVSWTLNRDVAAWFARRFSGALRRRPLWFARLRKADALAYFEDRAEFEVVLDPATLSQVRREAV